MLSNPSETIADWDSTRLVRFIKDLLEQNPPTFIANAIIEVLTVVRKLTIQDEIVFIAGPNFTDIGSTGAPAFANSWVNVGGAYNNAGYWKTPDGLIHLRGRIKTGTVGSIAFTLPVGYRPVNTEGFSVISNATIGYVEIDNVGGVKPLTPSNNTYVSLDGLSFKAK